MSADRASLTIVVRNAEPNREGIFPQTWMIHSIGQTVRVAVAHDETAHPYIEEKLRVA